MAYDQPPRRDSVLIEHHVTYLPEHLLNRRSVDLRVVRRDRVRAGYGIIRIPHVRQVDINDSVEQTERFQRLVPVRVVHYRQGETPLPRNAEGLQYLRHEVRGR